MQTSTNTALVFDHPQPLNENTVAPYPRPALVQRWEVPLNIGAIVWDIDGTVLASYKNLLVVQEAENYLMDKGLSKESASHFVRGIASEIDFQAILHKKDQTIGRFEEFISARQIQSDPYIKTRMEEINQSSFQVYEGFRQIQRRATEAGIFFAAYTNTPDYFAAHRLAGANIPADQVDALWAKKHSDYEPGVWKLRADIDENRREYAHRLIPYGDDCKKPNDAPLREISRLAGLTPEEILFVGEGFGDFKSVYADPKSPSAIFAFQEQGAQDICIQQQQVNEALRPGTEPLGHDHVNEKIKKLRIDERDFIRLPKGFLTLLDLIDQGQIRLSAPPKGKPRVVNHALVPAG